jgi:hypothetical protein
MEPSPARIRRSDRFKGLQAAVFDCIVFQKYAVPTAAEYDVSTWSLLRCIRAIKTGRVENARAIMREIESVPQSPDPEMPALFTNTGSKSDSDMPALVPNTGFDPNIPERTRFVPDPTLLAFVNNPQAA